MNRGTAKKTLTREQLVQFLIVQWNETKTKEAELEDMKSFLKNFVETVKAQFVTNTSIQKIQDVFMVSDCQACLQDDVINNEVEFKTREGRTFHMPGGTNFNKLCSKFFDLISKEKHWRGYTALKKMFDQLTKNNPSIDCLGIALKDVLRRLMRSNVIEAKYFMAKSKKTLTREQLVRFLTAQWNETKTQEAELDDMKNFLQKFEAKVKQQFDTDAPIETTQIFFMVSDNQACLEADVKNNEVEFKTKKGRTFDRPGDSDFNNICCKFFKLISTKQHWRGYAVLKDMFEKTLRNNPSIYCHGIALADVLRRLMKSNVIEARYFKAKSKLNTNETVGTLAIQLIAHIGILAAGLPENREALKDVYRKFVENIQNKPPGLESVTFDLVVQHLKSIKILKFSPGAADIVYLKETGVVIYEYFGRQENCSSEDNDGQASNDTPMNKGMTGSRIDIRNGSRNDLRIGSRNDLRTGSKNDLWIGSRNDLRTGSRNDLRIGNRNGFRTGSRNDLRIGSRNDLRIGSRNDLRTGSRNDLRTGSRTNLNNGDSSQKQGRTINKEKMRKLAKDAHGISITSDLDNEESREFGIINIGSHMQGERVMTILTILHNAFDGGEQLIALTGCKLLDNSNEVFTIGNRNNNQVLPISAGSSYQITVYYKSRQIGKHKCPLEIQFDPRNGKQPFSIFRFIEAETKDAEIDELQSNEPYQPKMKRQVAEEEGMHIIDGVPPEGMSNVPMEVYLGDYNIPSDIRYSVKKGGSKVSGAVKEVIKSTSLEPEAYLEKFHALLYLEELQMETNIRDFDMEHAELVKAGKLLSLEVPGLAEGKPSLLVGDQAYVRVESGAGQQKIKYDRKEYQGYIHVVERDRILLKFNSSFHEKFARGQRHKVRFSFNRGTIRLQHRAIDMACELIYEGRFPSVLDPQESNATPLLTKSEVNKISCYNRMIEDNAEQLTAVKNIVAGSSGSCPYIIFGPPGTGKTVTCVEAMKQVLNLSKNSRILACTPSNSAADLILQRLIKPCPIPKSSIFRFNAFSRSLNTLPDDFNIKDFCKIEDDTFATPTSEEIENYRVVICTMVNAGKLVSMGVPIDHFTHIFLDECGQAVEPEALIPLAGLIDPENKFGGQVVLAGDPKQLGPVLQSPIAIRHGLEVSLLERIMMTGDVYQRQKDGIEEESISRENVCVDIGRYNNKYITKLVKNYRTHPDILRQPNRLFYSNELVPSADDFKVTSLCQWSELPTKDFPIIFHGIEGEDAREGSSPSFFNRHEAVEVVKYVRALLDHKSLGVTPDEIGIISPYKKQVSKIRQLLMKERNRKRIEELKVGSVEEFQGQERRIIVISTVRSNREYLKMDSKFCLGFLKNPKRFNVAITRAQALLIIVGNPFVLAEDQYWKVLLDYCIERGGYRGCKYDDDVVSDLSTKFSDMMKAC